MAKRKTVAEIDAAISRWTTKLTRASNMLTKLRLAHMRAKQRLASMEAKQYKALTPAEQVAEPVLRKIAGMPKTPEGAQRAFTGSDHQKLHKTAEPIDTSVPDFLQRDKNAAEEIRKEQAEIKRRKTAGRSAKMKAVKSGETRKMPLTGKAALEAIRNGD